MRRYRLSGHGAIEKLDIVEAPSPQPGPGEAVVRMRAASLNPRDLMVILGPSPYGPRPGLTPLSDGAGEVLRVGEGVEGLAVGDRVVASFRPGWTDGPLDPAAIAGDLGGGADGVLAEEVCLPAEALVLLPANLGFEAAATLPCAAVTAWRALDVPRLSPQATVLVQGTGGVSLFALQLAVDRGCRVIATTSSAAKGELLSRLGADVVIDRTRDPDWDTAVRAATGGRGADRVVEVGGAGTLARSFAAAAHGGEIALVGLLSDPMAQVSPLPVLSRMLTLRGVSVGSRADLEAVVALAAADRLRPVIDGVFAFGDALQALRRLQLREHVGKIVIRI
jgi:NADPH:quinone reductase-like Zn-dependent oxidoreductase